MQQGSTKRSSTDYDITDIPGRGKGRVVPRKASLALTSSTTATLAVSQSNKARYGPTQPAPALEHGFRHQLTTEWGRQGQQDQPRYIAWLQSGTLPVLDLARPQHADTLRTTMRAGDPVATQRHSFCHSALYKTWTTDHLVRTTTYKRVKRCCKLADALRSCWAIPVLLQAGSLMQPGCDNLASAGSTSSNTGAGRLGLSCQQGPCHSARAGQQYLWQQLPSARD